MGEITFEILGLNYKTDMRARALVNNTALCPVHAVMERTRILERTR